MSSPLAELEISLLAQLRSGIATTDLAIDPYPPRPADYRLLHPRGAVLVRIDGSRYQSAATGAAHRDAQVIVTLLLRDFQQHQAAYEWLDTMHSLLLGFIPAGGWQAMSAVSDQFVSENEGVWQYDLMFTSRRLSVSAFNLCPLSIGDL